MRWLRILFIPYTFPRRAIYRWSASDVNFHHEGTIDGARAIYSSLAVHLYIARLPARFSVSGSVFWLKKERNFIFPDGLFSRITLSISKIPISAAVFPAQVLPDGKYAILGRQKMQSVRMHVFCPAMTAIPDKFRIFACNCPLSGSHIMNRQSPSNYERRL